MMQFGASSATHDRKAKTSGGFRRFIFRPRMVKKFVHIRGTNSDPILNRSRCASSA